MKKDLPKLIIGIGVILNHLNEVLIDQRKHDKNMGGMWEFPGGKKEDGELIQSTVSREIKEELGINVQVEEKLIEFDYSYPDQEIQFSVYFCKLISGTPQPLESLQVKWVHPDDLDNYYFPNANKIIIEKLKDYLFLDKFN